MRAHILTPHRIDTPVSDLQPGAITLLRHCATLASDQLCLGQLDVALSKPGEAHARELADCWPWTPDVLVCSDLLRARQTAAPFAHRFGLALQLDTRLRELDMGEFTGRKWTQIHQEQPDALAAWGQNFLNCGPPAGESFLALQRRVLEALTAARTLGERPLLITHAGPIRAVLAYTTETSALACMGISVNHGQSFQLQSQQLRKIGLLIP